MIPLAVKLPAVAFALLATLVAPAVTAAVLDDRGTSTPTSTTSTSSTSPSTSSTSTTSSTTSTTAPPSASTTSTTVPPTTTTTAPPPPPEPASPVPDPNGYGAFALAHFAEHGWSDGEYPALVALWNRESGDPGAGSSAVTWTASAANPSSTAFGIAQFLDSTWQLVGCVETSDPWTQILCGMAYVAEVYGTPSAALAFHDDHNWY